MAIRGGALVLVIAGAACSEDVGPRTTIDAGTEITLHADGVPQRPVVEREDRGWLSFQLREPGNAVHDPATGRWVLTYSGVNEEDLGTRVGASYSDDGLRWTPDPRNPITGDVGAEDPFLVRRTDGELYRDADQRALMLTEQKGEPGLDLWRSEPGSLSRWTRVGPVLSKGPADAWDGFDRSSPAVVADGDRLIMLFEGRSQRNAGEIGYATSDDGGASWTVHPEPVVRRGPPGSWNDYSVVTDDVIAVGSKWVLFVHGQKRGEPLYTSGRYVSSDPPGAWGPGSFTELPGNPFAESNSVMPLGDDPSVVVWLDRYRSLRLASVHERSG